MKIGSDISYIVSSGSEENWLRPILQKWYLLHSVVDGKSRRTKTNRMKKNVDGMKKICRMKKMMMKIQGKPKHKLVRNRKLKM